MKQTSGTPLNFSVSLGEKDGAQDNMPVLSLQLGGIVKWCGNYLRQMARNYPQVSMFSLRSIPPPHTHPLAPRTGIPYTWPNENQILAMSLEALAFGEHVKLQIVTWWGDRGSIQKLVVRLYIGGGARNLFVDLLVEILH